MSEIKVVGRIEWGGIDMRKRVYGVDGIAPTLDTCQGGKKQVKILDEGLEIGMKTLKVNDLFCGAGGMGLGFKNAGFEIAGAWDFDKYAVQSYGHNVGDHVKQADISQMKADELPPADVWTFGFPCQDLSVAGKKAGMELKCSDCGHEFKIGGDGGFVPSIDQILMFNNKKFCPKCESLNIKASNRSGLFFEVMRLLDETENKPKIIIAENVKGLKPYLGVLEEEYTKRGYKMYYTLYNSKFWGVPQNRERYFVVGVHESIQKEFIFPTQQEYYIPRLLTILEPVVDEKYYIDEEKATNVIKQAREKVKVEQIGFAMRGRYNQDGSISQQVEFRKDDVTSTLTGVQKDNMLLENLRVRKLTPREYARLQGFPESFEFVVSDSQLYKQFGNAVTVNVAQAIAERIKMFLLSL
jgi:DNA (cytosine-5)-methyltransferase 1